jgi:polysaccharide export outer membrane protein
MTLDQKSNEVFSTIAGSAAGNSYMNITDQNLYLTSYMVSDSGFINFPLLGKINANGKTIHEMEVSLNSSVSDILREASVVVKLVMYNISILGEVKNPGKYTIYNNRVNIFEAIAMANDLTTFANRSKVQIIRNQGNKNNIVTVDLQSKDILTSPYYYLQPNDIVYIEPLKNKSFAFETFPYALLLGGISTLFIVATFFK